MQNFILFIDNMENIDVHSPTYKSIYDAFKLMEKHRLDFDDALVVSIMQSLKVKELVSFDKDFDKVKEIKRLEPGDVAVQQN